MAVLTNTMLQGTAADTGEDSFQIERSLRFNREDDPALERYIATSGNTKKWTWSGWIKKSDLTNSQTLFSGRVGSGAQVAGSLEIRILSGTQLYISFCESNGTPLQWSAENKTFYRDPSAWQHWVVVLDTGNSEANERCRVYVNGKKVVDWGTRNTLTQNFEYGLNKTGAAHVIGAHYSGNNITEHFNGYFSDVYFIDGLALPPSAFAEIDATTGAYNPKAFARPQINDGTVWSTPAYWSGTEKADAPYDNGFDGDTSNTIAKIDNSGTTGWYNYTFTPPNPIKFVDRVEVHGSLTSVRWSINGGPWTTGSSNGIWDTIATGGGTITTINIEADNNYPEWRGIRIDGVVLLDGVTDPDTYQQLNDGGKHSDNVSGTIYTGYPLANAFNGNVVHTSPTGRSVPNSDSWLTWTPPTAISDINKLRVWFGYKTTNGNFKINGTQNNTNLASGTNGWIEYTGYTSISSIAWYCGPSGAEQSSVGAIEIDGVILLDDIADNSFHLKFNDTSLNRYLGKDTLNGKIEDATGGLPIYNTKATSADNQIDYGDVKDTGYREDNKPGGSGGNAAGTTDGAGLVLAWPGTVINGDEHDHINTGSSPKTVNASNNAAISTAGSRFYGSSGLVASGAASPGDAFYVTDDADLAFGTGDYTVEFWFNPTHLFSNFMMFDSRHPSTGWPSSSTGFALYSTADGPVNLYTGGSLVASSGNGALAVGSWTHVAAVRNSGTVKLYINGIEKASASNSSNHTEQKAVLGNAANYATGGEGSKGYYQDWRIYRSAKYTANFTAPTRNDCTVNNIIAAASGKVYTSGSDWDEDTWDGDLSSVGGTTGGSYQELTDQSITVNTSFEIYSNDEAGQVNTIKDGNGNEYQCTDDVNGTNWRVLYNANSQSGTNFTGTLTGPIQIKVSYGGSHIYGVRVDGVIVTNQPLIGTDSLTDTPTNYGTGAQNGGEVRGNYPTFNPLQNINWGYGSWTLRQGNLEAEGYPSSKLPCTLGASSGKYYWEVEYVNSPNTGYIGIIHADADIHADWNVGTQAAYGAGGSKNIDGSTSTYGNTYTAGDVIGVQWDADNGNLYFWKNGVAENSGTALVTGKTGLFVPFVSTSSASSSNNVKFRVNFGQRAFKYTNAGTNRPSADYKCLCTQNLDDTFSGDELNNPSKYFDIKTYTGDGADGRDIKGFNFQPELVWIKSRDTAYSNILHDVVRGTNKYLSSDSNAAEGTDTNALTDFNSDGFEIGGDWWLNKSGEQYVSWAWDAGSAGAANNDGSINVTNQWKNPTAGFSITKYVSNNTAGATVGHGLGVPPEFIIVKNTDDASNWGIYHKGIGNTHTMWLDLNNAAADAITEWNDTSPTNTVFSLGNGNTVNNASSHEYIAYCFAPIAGYSAFGTYTGNGSTDGPFIYTGFLPKLVIIKRSSGTSPWTIMDTERDPINPAKGILVADTDSAEDTSNAILDFVSNGFKHRQSSDSRNSNNQTFVYAAWAENPFKQARAF